MLHKTRLVRALVAAFGGTAALWSPALLYAQDNGTPPAQAGDQDQVQRVTVTGTNIRRTDAETPSPVQVLSADDIKQSGFTSIQEVLQSISANGQGTLSQGFSGAFASGASGIALRGLTTAATLVLIDGHRSAPYPIGDDGQRSFVDIANIPFDAVERIEILKDGASAIYGSDAIAGVVNIILRRSYTGASVTGEVGTSWKQDGSVRKGSMIYGIGDLDKDGHNFYLAIEGRSQDQIRFVDRGGQFTKTNYTSQGGLDTTLGVPNEANGGYARSGTGYITDPDGNRFFLPGCNETAYQAGQCTYRDTWSQIVPNTANFNAVSRFTFNLTPSWQASLEGTFFQSKAEQVGFPSRTFPGGYQGITSGPNVVPNLLNPVVPTLPDTNPAFPQGTGLTSGVLRYTFLDIGPTVTSTDAKTTRLVADLQGNWMDWDIQASLGYTQVKLAVRGTNYVEPALLQDALDSTTNPYIPGQANSSSVIGSIAPTLYADDVSKLEFGHISGSHDLMPLDGGPLSLALGVDAFHRVQSAVAPAQVNAGELTGIFSNNYTLGYQNVVSGFGELVAPFRKDFEAELQARYDHYNLSGGRLSPKLGFKWTPSQAFALRGTVSKGFRAPSPAENGVAGQTFFAGSTNDEILCPDGDPNGVGNFPSQCSIAVGTVQSTNPHLKAETSKSWTLGAIVEPVHDLSASIDLYSIEIDNQIVAANSTNAVRGSNFTPIERVIDGQGDTDFEVPPVAPIAYFTDIYVNANKTKTQGVDVDLQWRHRMGEYGDFKSDLTVSYTSKYDLTIDGVTYHLAGTHGPLIIGGDTGNPKTRFQWANTYARGPWELTGTVNFTSGFSMLDPSFGVNDCPTALSIGAGSAAFEDQIANGVVPPGVACHVGSFYTFDLAARYTANKHWSIYGSILNLFNQGAPLDWGTYGGGTAPYNPSFHQQGAVGRFYNVGMTYAF
jgi:iron complex outermembrane receptor protein